MTNSPGGSGPTPDLRAQAGPHVFVDDLDGLHINDQDRHHLTRSLRLRNGDPLTVSDGAGAWRSVCFGEVLEPTSEIHQSTATRYELTLACALTKAAKPEFVVQKATEIGIDHIIVFQATHSVARWDASKQERNVQRLTKVAREAAMQSRRTRLPTVRVGVSLAEIATLPGVARADFGGVATNSEHRCIVIGPEGGWAASEKALIPQTIDLGPTVLRAETAAVVAAAFLTRSRHQHA